MATNGHTGSIALSSVDNTKLGMYPHLTVYPQMTPKSHSGVSTGDMDFLASAGEVTTTCTSRKLVTKGSCRLTHATKNSTHKY